MLLIELQIKLTSWAIGSLAGGGLGKVKEGEEEKSRPRHSQGRNLRLTIVMKKLGLQGCGKEKFLY